MEISGRAADLYRGKMKRVWNVLLILPVLCLVFAACGGSAIGEAQKFSPNDSPVILSIKAVNFDGSVITQLDIEPYKQFKLIVEASDPDNNPLDYKFDSESGTFAGISGNSSGCTAIFKTGRVTGGQNVGLWVMVSDGNGGFVRQSYNLGTGKSGAAITANLDRIRFKPSDAVKLSVSANCSGFFQLYCDGTGTEDFKFEKDAFRYSYSENKTIDFILAGPEYNGSVKADIYLDPKTVYINSTSYNLVLVFRDGLSQTGRFAQTIYVDEQKPVVNAVNGFSPVENVSLSQIFTVNFCEEIGYADSSSLELDKGGNVKLLSISGKTVEFAVSGLKALTQYNATISGIKDIAGNEILPDSSRSFVTRGDENNKFIVVDAISGKTEYKAYCGFIDTVNLQLKALYEANPVNDVSYSSSDPALVSVSTTGMITINTYGLNEVDKTVMITAAKASTADTSVYMVIIKPYYIVTKASEFGENGIIDANLNGRFRLGNDIDFNWSEVSTIGSYNLKPFTGVFDGNSKTLKNIKFNSTIYAGLFSYNMGIIKNLNIKNAAIDGDTRFSGIIAGFNQRNSLNPGIIDNCILDGITISNVFSSDCGAVAGKNFGGEINNCDVMNTVIAASSSGGIAGGSVNHDGFIEKISNCAVMSTTVTGNNCGGLVGETSGGSILNCSSTASVNGFNNIGGLIGAITNTYVADCYSTGNINGTESVGGLIGYVNDANSSVQRCYSVSQVTASQYYGELIGYVNFPIAGGFSCTESYYLDRTVNSSFGFPQTIDALQLSDTYDNWQFDSVWKIDSSKAINNGFPYLANKKPPQ